MYFESHLPELMASAVKILKSVHVLHEIIQKIPVQLRNVPRGISL